MAAREERPAGRGPGMSGDRQRTVAGTLGTGEEGDTSITSTQTGGVTLISQT